MRVYISGKIGEEVISAYTLQKFAKAEQMLKSKGYEVFNPTKSGLGAHAESLAMKNGTTFWEEIVILDLEELKKCSAIYMLEDWKKSDGAQTEYYYARGAGKKMFFQNRIHGCEYLDHILSESWKKCRPLMLPEEGEDEWDCSFRFEKNLTLYDYEKRKHVLHLPRYHRSGLHGACRRCRFCFR